MHIRALLIDFYDVLYGYNVSQELRDFEARLGLSEGGLRQALSQSQYFDAARLGHVSGETLWRDVAERIGVDPEAWQSIVRVHESSFGFNEEFVAFLQSLRPHYKIALLSNATPHVRALITQHAQLRHLFDALLISAEEGLKKPEPAMYQRALRQLEVQPQETIFVDDDRSYAAAAEALGIQCVVFQTTGQAIADIRALLESGEQDV